MRGSRPTTRAPAPSVYEAKARFSELLASNPTIHDGLYGCVTPCGRPPPLMHDIDHNTDSMYQFLTISIQEAFSFVSIRLGAATCDRDRLHGHSSLTRCIKALEHAWEWMFMIHHLKWNDVHSKDFVESNDPLNIQSAPIINLMTCLMTWTHLAGLLVETCENKPIVEQEDGLLAARLDAVLFPILENHYKVVLSVCYISVLYDATLNTAVPVLAATRPFFNCPFLYKDHDIVGSSALVYFSESIVFLSGNLTTSRSETCSECIRAIVKIAQTVATSSGTHAVAVPPVSDNTTLRLARQISCRFLCQTHLPREETREFDDSWPEDEDGHMKTKSREFSLEFQRCGEAVTWAYRRQCYAHSVLCVCRSVAIKNPHRNISRGKIAAEFRRVYSVDMRQATLDRLMCLGISKGHFVQQLYGSVCFSVCSDTSAKIDDIVGVLDEMCDVVGIWFETFFEHKSLAPIRMRRRAHIRQCHDRILAWRSVMFRDMTDLVVALLANLEAAEQILMLSTDFPEEWKRATDAPVPSTPPWHEKMRKHELKSRCAPMRRLIAIVLEEGRTFCYKNNTIEQYIDRVDRSLAKKDGESGFFEHCEQMFLKAKKFGKEEKKRQRNERIAAERTSSNAMAAEAASRQASGEMVARVFYKALAPQRAADQARNERLLAVKASNRAKSENVANQREARERVAKQEREQERRKEAHAKKRAAEKAALQKREEDEAARAASRAALRKSKARVKEADAAAASPPPKPPVPPTPPPKRTAPMPTPNWRDMLPIRKTASPRKPEEWRCQPVEQDKPPVYRPRPCLYGDACPKLIDQTCVYSHGDGYIPARPVCRLGRRCSGYLNGNKCLFLHPSPRPSCSIPEEKRKECAVCLEAYEGRRPTALSCGHVFCKTCASPMVECPTCRQAVAGKIEIFL